MPRRLGTTWATWSGPDRGVSSPAEATHHGCLRQPKESHTRKGYPAFEGTFPPAPPPGNGQPDMRSSLTIGRSFPAARLSAHLSTKILGGRTQASRCRLLNETSFDGEEDEPDDPDADEPIEIYQTARISVAGDYGWSLQPIASRIGDAGARHVAPGPRYAEKGEFISRRRSTWTARRLCATKAESPGDQRNFVPAGLRLLRRRSPPVTWACSARRRAVRRRAIRSTSTSFATADGMALSRRCSAARPCRRAKPPWRSPARPRAEDLGQAGLVELVGLRRHCRKPNTRRSGRAAAVAAGAFQGVSSGSRRPPTKASSAPRPPPISVAYLPGERRTARQRTSSPMPFAGAARADEVRSAWNNLDPLLRGAAAGKLAPAVGRRAEAPREVHQRQNGADRRFWGRRVSRRRTAGPASVITGDLRVAGGGGGGLVVGAGGAGGLGESRTAASARTRPC